MDTINNPSHYNQGSIECIQAIEASMSLVEFQGYLKGNAMKYLWRYKYKGKAKEDLEKNMWYVNRLIESLVKTPADFAKEQAEYIDKCGGVPLANMLGAK